MTMIDDFDATYERHRKQVEMLINRQNASKKIAKHLRLGVLRRQLIKTGKPRLTTDTHLISHFEPNLVKLAISAATSMAQQDGKRNNNTATAKTSTKTSRLHFQPTRPSTTGGGASHNNQRVTRKRARRQSTDVVRSAAAAKDAEHNDATARSFHPLIHVYGNRNSVKDGIHVTEGGACDFYTIKLLKRPKQGMAVHIAIQDQHLQTLVEPRVLRFNERDWATPQFVCVSAIDDTDKSSESVESTFLEHVTASGDSNYNDIRFEVPVRISDNDGHYLWGFGSNVYRQFGVDEVGSGASLPAPISGNIIETQQKNTLDTNGRKDSTVNSSGSESGSDSSNGTDSGEDSEEESRSTNTAKKHKKGKQKSSSSPHKRVGQLNGKNSPGNVLSKKVSFVNNAKATKPSMLFASIAAGRFTTCATQTNGKTVMHGRNDGRLWHDSRGYHSLPFSRRIGTKKTYIVAVSAGTNHCMAINVGGTLLTWGMNTHGQLGIGDPTVTSVQVPTPVLGPLKGSHVIQINCGNCHTGALGESPKTGALTLYTWGSARTGALGLHDPTPSSKKRRLQLPVYVPGLSDVVVDDEDNAVVFEDTTLEEAGGTRKFAVSEPHHSSRSSRSPRSPRSPASPITETSTTSSSSSSAVGANRFLPEPVLISNDKSCLPFQVDCGWAHTAVLCGQGKLFTCGWGGNGRLGRIIPPRKTGFYEGADPTFRRVHIHLTGVNDVKPLLIVNVACGRKHTLALDSERVLWSWGANHHGQLGLGHRISQAVPRMVKMLRPFSRSAVTRKRRQRQQEQEQQQRKQQKQLLKRQQKQSMHEQHGPTSSNTNLNNNNNNNNNNNPLSFANTATKEKHSYDLLAAISCGDSHSCVITEHGLLYVFGNNESSQLGLGDGCNGDEVFPRLHHSSLSLDVRQVSCGANHTLVVTGETPQRIYHAKSSFDDIMLRHKKLVERDQRRRKKFTRLVNKAEERRKKMNWRRPVSMMIPSTKKAHAMSMTIHKKLMVEHRKQMVRPSSAAAGSYRRQRTSGHSRNAMLFPKKQNGTSRRTMKWERSLSPRPCIDHINSRNVISKVVAVPQRPSTAGTSRRYRSAGRRPETALPIGEGGERPVTRG